MLRLFPRSAAEEEEDDDDEGSASRLARAAAGCARLSCRQTDGGCGRPRAAHKLCVTSEGQEETPGA